MGTRTRNRSWRRVPAVELCLPFVQSGTQRFATQHPTDTVVHCGER